MIRASLINRTDWEKTAVIEKGECVSYRAAAQKAAEIQRLLQGSGGNAAIFLPNGSDYISAFYGVIMAGMAALPINIRLTVHEIVPLLARADIHTVVTIKKYKALFDDIIKIAAVNMIYMEETPALEYGGFDLPETPGADGPMVLLPTSGTTGNTRLVQLSDGNVTSSTLAYINKMDFEKTPANEIRLVIATPFCSVYGLMVLTACVIKSIPIVVIQETFTLDALYKTIAEHKVTHFEGGVPVALLMEQMAGRQTVHDIGSLRYFGMGGSKTSADTLKRLMVAYPAVEFWTGYGMTEAGPLIAKPYKKVNPKKLDSVGTAADCVTIKITDANGALVDTPHVRGEIVVKGAGVMHGYYKNEAETNKMLKGGYLYTGDIGYLDEDGYLYICGRKKNVIVVRGFNVHAEEVEDCLFNSGLVKDCVVYGETTGSGNEIVCAGIVPKNLQVGADAIRAYCKEHLADYKWPQRIEMLDAIRKTTTGKTERVLKSD